MANSIHLKILSKGIDVWNKWKKEHQYEEQDLSEIDLQFADLRGANFINVNLKKSNFFGANLTDANFLMADLRNAQFSQARLSNATLYSATLYNADFAGADLSYARLGKAKMRAAKLLSTILRGANLTEADLSDASCRASYFEKANLSRANLSGTNLENSQFEEANLYRANLLRANLKNAKLIHTCFKNADLRWVNFNGTQFNNTDLQEAKLGFSVFSFTDLSTCVGLESVVVSNQCAIDFQTLESSGLSEKFLLKIGLPKTYIDYLPDFYEKNTSRFFPVFLSHSGLDKVFASKLYEALSARKVLVWYDEKMLKPGDDVRESITKGIDFYDKLIIVCSENSLKNSWWVDKELNRALKKEEKLFREKGKQINTIIPITIDNFVFDKWDDPKKNDINRYSIGDFRNWQDDENFEKKLNDLITALDVDRRDDNPISYY